MNYIVVQNVYHLSEKSEYNTGFLIKFGNANYGYYCSDIKDLPKMWNIAIHQSQGYRYPGDVSLFKNGKLIRALNNGEQKILDKDVRYKYRVNKY